MTTFRKIIGRLYLPAVQNHHRTFEYAGAGEIWNLDEATIDIYEPHDQNNYWFYGQRPGTRIDSWFQNRIGDCYGSDNRDKTPKLGTIGVQFDSYGAGRMAAAGRLELFNGWTWKKVGTYNDGTPMYKAVKEETEK